MGRKVIVVSRKHLDFLETKINLKRKSVTEVLYDILEEKRKKES